MTAEILDELGLGEDTRPWELPKGAPDRFVPAALYLGQGQSPLEVIVALAPDRPRASDVKILWDKRRGKRASPVLCVVLYRHSGTWRAGACGPSGSDPRTVLDLDIGQMGRICSAALDEPNRHAAARLVMETMPEDDADLAGLRNAGMFATHELRTGVPGRGDWASACERGEALLSSRGRDLVERLGFGIERRDTTTFVLRAQGAARAVAIFLQESESPEGAEHRYGGMSPASHALAAADREGLPYVVLTRGQQIRLYAAGRDVGVGRKGRAETFIELNLAVLPTGAAGYLPLIFGAEALKLGGTFEDILERSRDFATGLGERLRDRVYEEAVPRLATAVAADGDSDAPADDLDFLYEQAMVILFRLLFIAYAEDKDLLPYRASGEYGRHALKTTARELADRILGGREDFDPAATDLWNGAKQLFRAVELGNADWNVPAYDGSLFSSDPAISRVGAAIAHLELTNDEFGPALSALVVDRTSEGLPGPVDFRSLSVREFGTIYEGLLESSLAIAPEPLTTDRNGNYIRATDGARVVVETGTIYLHNRSGARKASGSYFTKPFAVEHLLEHALEPALDAHVERLTTLMDQGDEAGASAAFFDFRCADIAMGSGHFLVAAVDRIEARLSSFLAERPVPAVMAEIERLRRSALDHLGDLAQGVEIEHASLLRRQVARRCVYGVDLNQVAVELARLSLWIHTFVPGLPLSFLDRNIVCGDSLTGIGTLDEAVAILDPSAGKDAPSLYRERIESLIGRATEALTRLARASDADASEVAAARDALESAKEAVAPAADLFSALVAIRLGDADPIEEIDEDAIASHPQRPRIVELANELRGLHFPLVFPEVFLRDCGGFDCVVGNPPWEELTVEKSKWWNLRFPGLRSRTEAEQRKLLTQYEEQQPLMLAEYQEDLRRAETQRGVLSAGPYEISGGDPDLYKYFAWRFWQLVRDGGAIGVVLPQGLFAAKGSAPWRGSVLPLARALVVFCRNEREWLFDDVNPGYTITLTSITSVRDRSDAHSTQVVATVRDERELARAVTEDAVELDLRELQNNDADLCLPRFETSGDVDLFATLIRQPGLGRADRPDFELFAATELHATNDRRFFRDSGDPVFNHLNIDHLAFDESAGVFAYADVKEVADAMQKRRLRSHGRRNSPLSRMPSEWARESGTLPLRHPRLAIRDVVHASNPRKVWCALVPPGAMLTNKAPYVVFVRGEAWHQAYVLGMLASSVCDWFGHLRVVLNLNFFILNALPVPLVIEDDPRVERLVSLSASIAMTGLDREVEHWSDLADEGIVDIDAARAEIDGIASLLYGLDDSVLHVIWPEDHRTRPALEDVCRYREEWQTARAVSR